MLMFGFYPGRVEKDFRSNPSVDDVPIVKGKVVDGVVRNEIVRLPQPKCLLDGVIYDEDTMSLRAKLNLGVQLAFVPNADLDNDPNVVYNKIQRLSNTITNYHSQLLQEEASVVEPSQSE